MATNFFWTVLIPSPLGSQWPSEACIIRKGNWLLSLSQPFYFRHLPCPSWPACCSAQVICGFSLCGKICARPMKEEAIGPSTRLWMPITEESRTNYRTIYSFPTYYSLGKRQSFSMPYGINKCVLTFIQIKSCPPAGSIPLIYLSASCSILQIDIFKSWAANSVLAFMAGEKAKECCLVRMVHLFMREALWRYM